MKRNIFYIVFLMVLFTNCKKEQGESFLVNHAVDALTMVKTNTAYPYAKAYLDSLIENEIVIDTLLPGQISTKKDTLVKAVVTLEVNLFDIDSLILLKTGLCWSETDTAPDMSNSYIFANATITIKDNTFKFNNEISHLKTDTRYYVRSFVIATDLRSGRVDTGYNQQVLNFRTRIPKDVWFSKKLFTGTPRSEAATFVVDNYAYIAGGENGKVPMKDTWRYDANNDAWSQCADMEIPRTSAVAFVVPAKDGVKRGYVGLGIVDANGTKTADFINYNPGYNYWGKDFIYRDFEGGERVNAIAFTLTDNLGKARAFVGFGENKYPLNDLYWYDQKGDTAGSTLAWRHINASGLPGDVLTHGLTEACATELNNKGYIFGGINGSGVYQKNLIIFDLETNYPDGTYSVISNFTGSPRANGAMFSLTFEQDGATENYVYISTGRTNNNVSGAASFYLDDLWGYDINQATWERKSNYKGQACEGGIGFDIKKDHDDYGLKVLSRGFIGMGKNSGNTLSREIWEYLP